MTSSLVHLPKSQNKFFNHSSRRPKILAHTSETFRFNKIVLDVEAMLQKFLKKEGSTHPWVGLSTLRRYPTRPDPYKKPPEWWKRKQKRQKAAKIVIFVVPKLFEGSPVRSGASGSQIKPGDLNVRRTRTPKSPTHTKVVARTQRYARGVMNSCGNLANSSSGPVTFDRTREHAVFVAFSE